jgi:hypothetical protein
MGEKHWLVRASRDYWRVDMDHIKRKVGGTWSTNDRAPWITHATPCTPSPDGTVYGHKLEPGGGPVDVSEGFPDGGRRCQNCRHAHVPMMNRICRTPDDNCCGHVGGYPNWEPPEQMKSEAHSAAGKARGEDEGGCEMKKYSVDVIEEPTVVGAQGGEGPRDIVKDFRCTASSERGAIFLAGREVKPDVKFAEERLAFAIHATDFSV